MADAYWRYSDGRQPLHQTPPQPVAAKRLRTDYDVPGGHDLTSYLSRDDIRGAAHGVRDTESIDASYERYLRNSQLSSYTGGQSARPTSGGISSFALEDHHVVGLGGVNQGMAVKERTLEYEGRRPEILLPADATSTLFVEGLPSNCTRREVSHIFRPFVGYKEVRLVNKESRHSGDPLVLCFVDFASPAHAATALDALQGYIFDEHDRDPVRLRLQFARYPGARSGGGHRGKR